MCVHVCVCVCVCVCVGGCVYEKESWCMKHVLLTFEPCVIPGIQRGNLDLFGTAFVLPVSLPSVQQERERTRVQERGERKYACMQSIFIRERARARKQERVCARKSRRAVETHMAAGWEMERQTDRARKRDSSSKRCKDKNKQTHRQTHTHLHG